LASTSINGAFKAPPSRSFFHSRERKTAMIRLALRYARYALTALATIGFGIDLN
jgi:hypothetical protein